MRYLIDLKEWQDWTLQDLITQKPQNYKLILPEKSSVILTITNCVQAGGIQALSGTIF